MIYYGLIITGTDTGVGKTELGCALARAFRKKGLQVGVFKPVETGCKKKGRKLIAEDAQRLARASGIRTPLNLIAPYQFSLPASPFSSARAEGKEIFFEKIYQIFDELAGEYDLVLVESAGGLLVPVNENFLFADLIKPMHLPILLVAENRLGVINQVLLNLEVARSRGLEILGVVLNQTQPVKVSEKLLNAELIEKFGKVKVLMQINYLAPSLRARKMTEFAQKLVSLIEPEIRRAGQNTLFKYF